MTTHGAGVVVFTLGVPVIAGRGLEHGGHDTGLVTKLPVCWQLHQEVET